MKNAYQILGVNPDADLSEIKDVYRRLSVKWHPDKNKTPEAQHTFAAISEAYRILSNPNERRELDEKISKGLIENINETVEHAVDAYLDTIFKD